MTKAPALIVGPEPRWRTRWPVLFSVLAAGALLLAACGGSPSSDGAVAHLGTTTTAHGGGTPASTQSGDGSGAGAGSGPERSQSHFSQSLGNQAQALAFSHCMQTHGVPNYPDPNGQGVVTGSGLDPNSPSFQAAGNHCRHLLPNGGVPTAAQQAQAMAQALKFSRCMRAHGVADFPDPQSGPGGGGIRISIRAGKGSDLNPQNPQFQSAQNACQGILGGPKAFSKGGGAK